MAVTVTGGTGQGRAGQGSYVTKCLHLPTGTKRSTSLGNHEEALKSPMQAVLIIQQQPQSCDPGVIHSKHL